MSFALANARVLQAVLYCEAFTVGRFTSRLMVIIKLCRDGGLTRVFHSLIRLRSSRQVVGSALKLASSAC